MTKRSILGTPLGSLLSSALIDEPLAPTTHAHAEFTETVVQAKPREVKQPLMYLPVERLMRSPYQPRQFFHEESLSELADSIRAQGVIQPIVVRPAPGSDNAYQIIAGERRWRAAQLAGLFEVPVVVRDVPDETVLAFAIVENLQREDLNPLEEAMGLERLVTEFELTHQAVADLVGKSRVAVTQLLRLLTLAEPVKTMMHDRQLEMGHARAMLTLPADQQIRVAQRVVANGMSVRQTEAYVRLLQNTAPRTASTGQDPDILSLENRLSQVLGTKVMIQNREHGKGKLVIEYHSLEALDGILAHLVPDTNR